MASQQSQGPLVPRIQLSQSVAVDFIDTRLPAYHPAFNHPHARFDAGRQRFVDDSLTPNALEQPSRPVAPRVESMAFWSDILPNAMIQLSTMSEAGDRKQSDYSIRTLKTWEDIKEKLDLAKAEYGYLENGAKDKPKLGNRLKSSTRKILDTSIGPLQQAVGFVPNIELASPVTTTVKMLLDAYKNSAEFRRDVDGKLMTLDESFVTVDFHVTRFPHDENIITAATNVVFHVLKAVEQTIGFYTSNQVRRAAAAIFRGTEYQKKLKDSLIQIRESVDELEKQGARSTSHQDDMDFQRNRLEHAALYQQNQEEHGTTQRMVQLTAMNQFYLLAKMREELHDMKQQQRLLTAELIQTRSRSSSPIAMHGQIGSASDIWDLLHIPEIDAFDLEYVINKSRRFPYEDHGRAEQVVTTSHFKKWILADKDWEYTGDRWVPAKRGADASSNDSTLLVHGDFDSRENMSPFSRVCASLTETFRKMPGSICLVFFCGRHLDKDEYFGPSALIRSLIGQLLQQYPYCPPDLEHNVSIQGVKDGSIHELCNLFGCLAKHVQATFSIFCIIEGIQFYERAQFRGEAMEILSFLSDLAENEQQGVAASIKLLLLSPRPTTLVRNALSVRPALLNMAAVSAHGQGSSPARFNRQISSVLSEASLREEQQN